MRWELLSSQDKSFVLEEAVVRGWAEKKVQVKKYMSNGHEIWTIEPYEGDCKCRNLVRYEDYTEGNI